MDRGMPKGSEWGSKFKEKKKDYNAALSLAKQLF